MNTINKDVTCNDIYYGHWFWGIVGYDGFLLLMLVLLSPFVIKSQRNYKEGLLLVVGSILCLIVWCIWVPICVMNSQSREAAIPLGAQGTALAILGGILVPRAILIVKSIARSDLVQALPSLTSLAFAQAANQYASEQVSVSTPENCSFYRECSFLSRILHESDSYFAPKEVK